MSDLIIPEPIPPEVRAEYQALELERQVRALRRDNPGVDFSAATPGGPIWAKVIRARRSVGWKPSKREDWDVPYAPED